MIKLSNLVLLKSRNSTILSKSIRVFSSDSHDDFKPIKKNIPQGLEDAVKLIQKQVNENDIILYMKGTPERPQCGFSAQAVRVLNVSGVDFASVNVLEYQSIREGVKAFSEWPTIPQLYVKGEFIGGADIITSMYNEGELQKLFQSKGLVSTK